MNDFTITVSDVEAYRATKGPDEVIGECLHVRKCLLAQTIAWKYPGTIALVLEHICEIYAADTVMFDEPLAILPLSPELIALVTRFDRILDEGYLVTNRQWEQMLAHEGEKG